MTRHLPLLTVLAALVTGAAAAAPASHDAELARTLEVTRRMVADRAEGQAEALLEGLTRTRPDDPRAWFYLAELRVKLGATRAATYAYHRAAGLSSPARRNTLAARLAALKLEAMPARDDVVLADEFLERSERQACRAAQLVGGSVEGLPCASALPPPDRGGFRIPPSLMKQFSEDPREWVRVAVAAHAPLRYFAGGYLRIALGDAAPAVRRQALRRLVSGAGEVELSDDARAAMAALVADPDTEVSLLAADFEYRHGRIPSLDEGAFEALVQRVDRGQASRELAKAVLAADPARFLPRLLQGLRSPAHDGKVATIMLLGLAGGRAGQRGLAEAFLGAGDQLGRFYGPALQALSLGTRGQALTLGTTPASWVQALAGE